MRENEWLKYQPKGNVRFQKGGKGKVSVTGKAKQQLSKIDYPAEILGEVESIGTDDNKPSVFRLKRIFQIKKRGEILAFK